MPASMPEQGGPGDTIAAPEPVCGDLSPFGTASESAVNQARRSRHRRDTDPGQSSYDHDNPIARILATVTEGDNSFSETSYSSRRDLSESHMSSLSTPLRIDVGPHDATSSGHGSQRYGLPPTESSFCNLCTPPSYNPANPGVPSAYGNQGSVLQIYDPNQGPYENFMLTEVRIDNPPLPIIHPLLTNVSPLRGNLQPDPYRLSYNYTSPMFVSPSGSNLYQGVPLSYMPLAATSVPLQLTHDIHGFFGYTHSNYPYVRPDTPVPPFAQAPRPRCQYVCTPPQPPLVTDRRRPDGAFTIRQSPTQGNYPRPVPPERRQSDYSDTGNRRSYTRRCPDVQINNPSTENVRVVDRFDLGAYQSRSSGRYSSFERHRHGFEAPPARMVPVPVEGRRSGAHHALDRRPSTGRQHSGDWQPLGDCQLSRDRQRASDRHSADAGQSSGDRLPSGDSRPTGDRQSSRDRQPSGGRQASRDRQLTSDSQCSGDRLNVDCPTSADRQASCDPQLASDYPHPPPAHCPPPPRAHASYKRHTDSSPNINVRSTSNVTYTSRNRLPKPPTSYSFGMTSAGGGRAAYKPTASYQLPANKDIPGEAVCSSSMTGHASSEVDLRERSASLDCSIPLARRRHTDSTSGEGTPPPLQPTPSPTPRDLSPRPDQEEEEDTISVNYSESGPGADCEADRPEPSVSDESSIAEFSDGHQPECVSGLTSEDNNSAEPAPTSENIDTDAEEDVIAESDSDSELSIWEGGENPWVAFARRHMEPSGLRSMNLLPGRTPADSAGREIPGPRVMFPYNGMRPHHSVAPPPVLPPRLVSRCELCTEPLGLVFCSGCQSLVPVHWCGCVRDVCPTCEPPRRASHDPCRDRRGDDRDGGAGPSSQSMPARDAADEEPPTPPDSPTPCDAPPRLLPPRPRVSTSTSYQAPLHALFMNNAFS